LYHVSYMKKEPVTA